MADFLREVATYGSLVNPQRFGPLATIVAQQAQAEMQREQMEQQQRQFDRSSQLTALRDQAQNNYWRGLLSQGQDQLALNERQRIDNLELNLATNAETRRANMAQESLARDKFSYDSMTDEQRNFQYAQQRFGPNDWRTRIAEMRAYNIPPEAVLMDDTISEADRERIAMTIGTEPSVREEGGSLYTVPGTRDAYRQMIQQTPSALLGTGRGAALPLGPTAQPDMRGMSEVWNQAPAAIVAANARQGRMPYSPVANDPNPVLLIERDPTAEINSYSAVGAPRHVIINGFPQITPPMDPTTSKPDLTPTMLEFIEQTEPTTFALDFTGDLVSATSQNLFGLPRAISTPYRHEKVAGSGIWEEGMRPDTDPKVMEDYDMRMQQIASSNRALTQLYTLLDMYGIQGLTEANVASGLMKNAWADQLNAWRQEAGTGALDQGAIDVFESILGTGFWRTEFRDVLDKSLKWLGSGEQGQVDQIKAQVINGMVKTGKALKGLRTRLQDRELKQHDDIIKVNIWGQTDNPRAVRQLLDHITKQTRQEYELQLIPVAPPQTSTMPQELAPYEMGRQAEDVASLTTDDEAFVEQQTRDYVMGTGRDLVAQLAKSPRDNVRIQQEVAEAVDMVMETAPEVILDRDSKRFNLLLETILNEELADIGVA